MMKKVIFFITCMILCSAAAARFSDTINYHLHDAATGMFNHTNDGNSSVFNNAIKFSVSMKSISLNNTCSWIWGMQEHQLINNDFTSALDLNLYKTLPHFNYWGLASVDKSYSLKINNRVQLGFGGAYDVSTGRIFA